MGVWQRDQLERWGQCKLRYPPNAKLNPERHSQGGVVEPNGQMWVEPRTHLIEQRDKASTESHAHVINVAPQVSCIKLELR